MTRSDDITHVRPGENRRSTGVQSNHTHRQTEAGVCVVKLSALFYKNIQTDEDV